MKKLLSWFFLLCAIGYAYVSITMITTDPGSVAAGFCSAAISFLLFLLLRKGKKQKKTSSSGKAATPVNIVAPVRPVETPAPTAPAAPKYEHIHIHVAGVTHTNPDGTDRQQLLRKIKYGRSPFEDNNHLDVALTPQTFTAADGSEEPAIGVYVNEIQIGFVPRDLISKVMYALEQPTATITALDIKGGGTHDGVKYPYGCLVVIRYEM